MNKMQQMLRDPYYTGVMVYKGEIIPEGRHERSSPSTLRPVQEIMDSRQQRGSRSRVHHHYLKGMLYCQRCHDNGRTSRLIFTEGRSHTGARYGYFKCRGHQDGYCDLPHLPVWLVEEAIENSYADLPVGEEFITEVKTRLDASMQDEQRIVRDSHTNLEKERRKLAIKEERLLDLAEDASLPRDRSKSGFARSNWNAHESTPVCETPAKNSPLCAGTHHALALISDPQTLYEAHPITSAKNSTDILQRLLPRRPRQRDRQTQTTVRRPPRRRGSFLPNTARDHPRSGEKPTQHRSP